MEWLYNKHVLRPGIGSFIHPLIAGQGKQRKEASNLNEVVGMVKIQDKVLAFWRDAINLVLGIWLIVSPFALGYAAQTSPAWNAYAIGIIVAVLSAAAQWQFQKWEEVSAVLGAWLDALRRVIDARQQMDVRL
jgi:hypothetical protein